MALSLRGLPCLRFLNIRKRFYFSVPFLIKTSKELWWNFFFVCLIRWNARIDLSGCPSNSTERAYWHLYQTIQDSSWMLDRKTRNESFTVQTGEIAQKLNQTVHSGSQWSFCQRVTRSKVTLGEFKEWPQVTGESSKNMAGFRWSIYLTFHSYLKNSLKHIRPLRRKKIILFLMHCRSQH